MDFGTVLTAMVTPFDTDGNIDFPATRLLIEHLLNNGTEGLVIAGTTGESPTLSDTEKLELFKYVIKIVDKRVPVIAGTGNNNTAASITLTKQAENLGADGIMLVTPYYNRPNQNGLIAHFTTIAETTHLPIMLYNIPSRSMVNMTAETTIHLSQVKNIVAVKESSADLDQISKIIENTHDDFNIYSGDDGMALPILSVGGRGVVSVASHVIGKQMRAIVQVYHSGQFKEAADLHREALPIIKGLFMAPNPVPVKAALNMIGLNVGNTRLPLVGLSDQEIDELRIIMHQ